MRQLCHSSPQRRLSFTEAREILESADQANQLAPLPIALRPAAPVEEADQMSESAEEAPAKKEEEEARDENNAIAAVPEPASAAVAKVAARFSCPNCSATYTGQSQQRSRTRHDLVSALFRSVCLIRVIFCCCCAMCQMLAISFNTRRRTTFAAMLALCSNACAMPTQRSK